MLKHPQALKSQTWSYQSPLKVSLQQKLIYAAAFTLLFRICLFIYFKHMFLCGPRNFCDIFVDELYN